MTEDQIQASCVQWFRMQYKDPIIFAIPNGGSRHVAEAMKLKRTGVLSGVPDLFVPLPMNGYGGLFIEMKRPKGYLTKNQKEMIGKLRDFGYKVEVCKSLDSFMEVVKDYMSASMMSMEVTESF